MERTHSRSIEVTVISAEGLLSRKKRPVKKNTFLVVRSDPFTVGSTGVDTDGGSYPFWNHKLMLELPADARFITVEAHSGGRVVGLANIPVTDFAGRHLPENYLSFLSYRLRDGNGEKNGIVNISVRVRGRQPAADGGGRGGPAAAGCPGRPFGGFPVVGGGRVAGGVGVVTGIPVSYRH